MQEDGRDGKPDPRRRAEGDQAHVLDAVVGEHPLVVALGDAAATPPRASERRATTTSSVRANPGPTAKSVTALKRRMA